MNEYKYKNRGLTVPGGRCRQRVSRMPTGISTTNSMMNTPPNTDGVIREIGISEGCDVVTSFVHVSNWH